MTPLVTMFEVWRPELIDEDIKYYLVMFVKIKLVKDGNQKYNI